MKRQKIYYFVAAFVSIVLIFPSAKAGGPLDVKKAQLNTRSSHPNQPSSKKAPPDALFNLGPSEELGASEVNNGLSRPNTQGLTLKTLRSNLGKYFIVKEKIGKSKIPITLVYVVSSEFGSNIGRLIVLNTQDNVQLQRLPKDPMQLVTNKKQIASISFSFPKKDLIKIDMMNTNPEWQRKGISKQLTEKLIVLAKSNPDEYKYVSAEAVVEASQKLLTNMGFVTNHDPRISNQADKSTPVSNELRDYFQVQTLNRVYFLEDSSKAAPAAEQEK